MNYKHTYTVTVTSRSRMPIDEAIRQSINEDIFDVDDYPSTNVAIESISEVARVVYPADVYGMDSIEITFSERVSKDAVESAIEYCYAIPYFGELLNIAWKSATECVVSCDTTKSRSDDVGARNLLDELKATIEDGPKSGKFEGVGELVELIEGKS